MRNGRLPILAAVAVGGIAGTCARAAVAQAWPTVPGRFPWGTFAVNLGGSFLLGLIMVLLLERLQPHRLVRPLLATGVCGAFTTFSTLVVEADLLVRAGDAGLAAGYLAATLVGGLAALVAGSAAGRRLPIRSRHDAT